MRVLRVSHSAVVDEWRGRERALTDLGVDVAFLSARRWHAGGVPVALEATPGRTGDRGTDAWARHPALFLYDPRPIWRALDEEWDVIDVHEEPFALATAEVLLIRALRRRSRRTPVVLYTAQNLRKRYPIPFRWIERWALRSASGISACNDDAARIVEAKGFAGRARVIPLGIDTARFRPTDAAAELPADSPPSAETGDTTSAAAAALGEGASPIVVGFLGRLVPEKGLLVLLDAIVRNVRLHLRIGGSGPLLDDLRERAVAAGVADRVELVGPVDPDDVVDFHRGLDVLAVPSLPTPSWTEQFGRVAVEAMACGVPVVSSDAGALPDVVGGAGIVVPAGDASALARALVEAGGIRAPELRASGLARAAECSWEAVGHDYLELYRSVVHAASAPLPGLEIVVVAYGAPELLRRALEPVAGLPVTVVDNSSLPEIAALCAELGVRYLDPGRNGGFAAGVNVGLRNRLVPGADVLLLNPDAVISADDVAVLQRALHARGDLASVGPAQVDDDGRPARVEWPFPSPVGTWLEALGLGSPAPRTSLRDRVGAAAARRGPRPGRRARRALLPLRRGDRLGVPRASARLAPCGGARRARPPHGRRHERRQRASRGALPRLPRALPPQAPRRARLAVGAVRPMARIDGAGDRAAGRPRSRGTPPRGALPHRPGARRSAVPASEQGQYGRSCHAGSGVSHWSHPRSRRISAESKSMCARSPRTRRPRADTEVEVWTVDRGEHLGEREVDGVWCAICRRRCPPGTPARCSAC